MFSFQYNLLYYFLVIFYLGYTGHGSEFNSTCPKMGLKTLG